MDWPPPAHGPPGDQARNPATWESNQLPITVKKDAQPAEPHWP